MRSFCQRYVNTAFFPTVLVRIASAVKIRLPGGQIPMDCIVDCGTAGMGLAETEGQRIRTACGDDQAEK